MKKIGQRTTEQEGITHIVEMTHNELMSFHRLNEICNNKHYDWIANLELNPRSFSGEFTRAFLAIRLFMEAQLQWNELSCMVDKFAGLLWPENEIEDE